MKWYSTAIYLALSSILLSGAFCMPAYFFWGIFIFLLPIFHFFLIATPKRAFAAGFWWAIVFFSTHFYAIIILLHENAEGRGRIFAGIALSIYCALYAGLWFWITAQSIKIKKNSILWISCCLLVFTLLYFLWIEKGVFWIFGSLNGYCFACPLLVLAEYPKLLMALPLIGEQGLFVSLCAMQLCLVLAFLQRSYKYLFFSFLLLTPFLCGMIQNKKIAIVCYVSQIGYVQPPEKNIKNMFDRAEEINMRISHKTRSNPLVKTILMPESTMYGSLNKHPQILNLWGENALADENITLIIGSFRTDYYENIFVTLYKMQGSRIIKYYDKTFLFPFTEFCPKFFEKNNFIRNLFLTNTKDFSSKENSSILFEIDCDLSLKPYICSDLYYGSDCALKNNSNKPILFAVNDSWFSTSYMKHLMFLFAIFKAIEVKRDLIYVGHFFGAWIDHTSGKYIYL